MSTPAHVGPEARKTRAEIVEGGLRLIQKSVRKKDGVRMKVAQKDLKIGEPCNLYQFIMFDYCLIEFDCSPVLPNSDTRHAVPGGWTVSNMRCRRCPRWNTSSMREFGTERPKIGTTWHLKSGMTGI